MWDGNEAEQRVEKKVDAKGALLEVKKAAEKVESLVAERVD